VALALRSKLLVLTGGPGVGKTTVLKTILQILMAKRVRPLLCAPTGRAAKRLAEVTGLEARTIHRLLEVNPRDGRFRRDERTPLDGDLIVVDEASMVDVPLMHALVRAVPRSAALLVVGDADQLPSVGPPGARRPAGVAGDPGGPAHHRVPAGGGEPDRRGRPPGQRRPGAAVDTGGRERRLLSRRRRRR
jgi:hypothetical protein